VEQEALRKSIRQSIPALTAQPKPVLQLAVVMDATGSVMMKTCNAIVRVVEKLLRKTRLTASVGLVLYRDVTDGSNRFSITDFQAPGDSSAFTRNLPSNESQVHSFAFGGGDAPEDAVGGLQTALTALHWDPNAIKVVLWTGDAPSHGYGCAGDSYPSGLPGQWTSAQLIDEFAKRHVHLAFMRLNREVDGMITALNAVPGSNLVVVDLDASGDCLSTLTKAFMGTMLMSITVKTDRSSHLVPALVPPPRGPVSFSDLPAPASCKVWKYTALSMEVEDKTALFYECLKTTSTDKLQETKEPWSIAPHYFSSGGCRYARCANGGRRQNGRQGLHGVVAGQL
jgi:hypothetical protein